MTEGLCTKAIYYKYICQDIPYERHYQINDFAQLLLAFVTLFTLNWNDFYGSAA